MAQKNSLSMQKEEGGEGWRAGRLCPNLALRLEEVREHMHDICEQTHSGNVLKKHKQMCGNGNSLCGAGTLKLEPE